MTKGVKLAMLKFIGFFKNNLVAKYKGEKILLAAEQSLGVCKRLDAVGTLTEEHVHYVLTKLSIVNNNKNEEHVQDDGQTIRVG